MWVGERKKGVSPGTPQSHVVEFFRWTFRRAEKQAALRLRVEGKGRRGWKEGPNRQTSPKGEKKRRIITSRDSYAACRRRKRALLSQKQ